MSKPQKEPRSAWKNRIVGTGLVDATELLANPRNWRLHPDNQRAALDKVLDMVGWVQNVIVNRRTGFVIDGHLRADMAISKGEKVPVQYVDLSPEEESLILATFDRLTAMAGVDSEKLSELVEDASEAFPDIEEILLGMDDLIEPEESGSELTDDDAVPEPHAEVVTTLGDCWRMGPHRLVCGDCRNIKHVERLFGALRANLVFTSPPYAEQREYDKSSGFRPIPPIEYVDWFRDVATNIQRFIAPDGSYFLNIKPSCEGLDTELYVMDLVLAHAREWGWHFATEFCWERNGVPKSVTQRFKNQFEPVYQFVMNRWKMRPDAVRHASDNVPVAGGPGSGETSWAKKQGGFGAHSVSGSFGAAKKRRNGTSELMSGVQGVAKDCGEYIGPGMAYPGNRLPTFAGSHDATGHTAAFPVGLPDFFIRAYTDDGDVVYDPFSGSGSTIIAAEKNGRVGLGMELSPAYCDVIIRRWQAHSGKSATLDGTERTFDEIAADRQPVAA